MRRIRLWFWLRCVDVLLALDISHAAMLWCLRRASDAVEWGPGEECGEEGPF